MTVLGSYTPVREAGNGSKVDFDFGFPVLQASDLSVGKILNSTGVLTDQVLGVDYTVALNPTTDGGTVTYTVAPTALQDSWIGRTVPATQPVDIPTNNIFREVQVETALDRATMVLQQNEEEIGRCFKVPVTDTGTDLTLPAPEAGTVLGWNDAEDALENKTPNTDTYLVKASTAEAEAGVEDTKFMTPAKTAEAIAALTPPVTGKVAGDGTVNPTNLLYNGSFESWSAGTSGGAPDGWASGGAGASVTQHTPGKIGTYHAGLTRSGADCYLQSTAAANPHLNAYYAGRSVTLSAWVFASVADRARIGIAGTNGDQAFSSYHTGDSTWQRLTVTLTVDAGSTNVYGALYITTGNTTAYVDGMTLVEGTSTFAFSPKPAEEGVWTAYSATSTIVGFSSFVTKSIYTKKIGKTVFVAFEFDGTSNANSLTFTLPYAYVNAPATLFVWHNAVDNGGQVANISKGIISSSTVSLSKDFSSNVWTASGGKRSYGSFFYETA